MLKTEECVIEKDIFFVFPFQGKDRLWKVCEKTEKSKWLCRIEEGCYCGNFYESISQEAIFDETHIKSCICIDNVGLNIFSYLERH